MKPTGLPPLSLAAMFRELYGDRHLEDFEVHEVSDGWVFIYVPLQVTTGKVLAADAREAMRRCFYKHDFARWLEAEVRKACDISPLRIMQIAQVGV